MQEFLIRLLTVVEIWIILICSLNLQLGYTGLLSLAQGAFFGTGAYAVAILTKEAQWPFLLAMAAAMALCAAMGLVIAIPSLRLRGIYFLIASLGFQLVVFSGMVNWVDLTRGPLGYYAIPQPELFGWKVGSSLEFAALATGIMLLCTLVAWRVGQSPFGLALKAIREDELAAESVGKSVVRFKATIFALGAALAAVAGGLYGTYHTAIDPFSFGIRHSVIMVAMVIIGGAGSMSGSILGACVFAAIPELLRFLELPSTEAALYREIIFGSLLVLLVFLRPKGLAGEYEVR